MKFFFVTIVLMLGLFLDQALAWLPNTSLNTNAESLVKAELAAIQLIHANSRADQWASSHPVTLVGTAKQNVQRMYVATERFTDTSSYWYALTFFVGFSLFVSFKLGRTVQAKIDHGENPWNLSWPHWRQLAARFHIF